MIRLINIVPPDTQKFRIEFLRPFVYGTILVTVGVVALTFLMILVFDHQMPRPGPFWHAFWPGPCIQIFFGMLIGVLVCKWVYLVGISAEGVYGYSAWGKRCFIGWQEIDSVKRLTVVGLVFLRLRSQTSHQVTWVPMFLSQPGKFQSEVPKVAPVGNVILGYLNQVG